MKTMRTRLTFANVISCLALFVALSGASYAATQLPKNSVGAKQLKKNAVTGIKVKDGSLLASDFKSGQLPAGDPGSPWGHHHPDSQRRNSVWPGTKSRNRPRKQLLRRLPHGGRQ